MNCRIYKESLMNRAITKYFEKESWKHVKINGMNTVQLNWDEHCLPKINLNPTADWSNEKRRESGLPEISIKKQRFKAKPRPLGYTFSQGDIEVCGDYGVDMINDNFGYVRLPMESTTLDTSKVNIDWNYEGKDTVYGNYTEISGSLMYPENILKIMRIGVANSNQADIFREYPMGNGYKTVVKIGMNNVELKFNEIVL